MKGDWIVYRKTIVVSLAISVLCNLLILLLIPGCSSENDVTDNQFTIISRDLRFSIYKENNTDILYICYHAGYGGGLTIMMDNDGLPLNYTKWKELSK